VNPAYGVVPIVIGVVVTGTGVAVIAVVVVAVEVVVGRVNPERTLMVLSSRRAVVRVAGRVPYHPVEGSIANVR
jgi:glycerol uptake facilitator-like aquaporin